MTTPEAKISSDAFPVYRGELEYVCLNCDERFPADNLLYSCPRCDSVLLLRDKNFASLKETDGVAWRKMFDERQTTRIAALRGVFRFYELVAPVFSEEDIIYLGEANTPVISASKRFAEEIGANFAFKNEGQNPSASFKDRGMACAFSFLKWICRERRWDEVLAICASTGDTSAAAALYAAYVGPPIKAAVLLPAGKVTPQQLSQPLGSGATVIELPGVFDDCMKVVEAIAKRYRVALLNSKNSWRILGQESYAMEVAQWRAWNVKNLRLFVPVGNAGNITAIMSGFLKLYKLNIIDALPAIVGVQSEHADPVFRYYSAKPDKRVYWPVKVRPSAAQAAMIGDPVSFPRVRLLADEYVKIGGEKAFAVMHVSEQEIMDSMILANARGHIACTQGGECLAALKRALSSGLMTSDETAVLDSTAHSLKFADFQDKYFRNAFETEYEIKANPALINKPRRLLENANPANRDEFAALGAEAVAAALGLKNT